MTLATWTTPQRQRQTAYEQLARHAAAAGCPADQVRNFIRGRYVPVPKAWAFHAAARECDRPDGPTRLAVAGGRGGAKSHRVLAQVLTDDCARVPGGLKWLFLRSVGKSARESFEDFLQRAFPAYYRYYVPSRMCLDLPGGSRVVLGGFRSDGDIANYIGIEYDGIIVDDAHLITPARHDQIRGSCRTSKPGWRPRMYYTYNPGGVGHAYLKKEFYLPHLAGTRGDTRFFFSDPTDNPFINPEYLAYLDRLTGWLYRAWRKGDMDIAAGQYFTTWQASIHVIDEVPLDVARWVLAMDWGFAHWCSIGLLAEGRDGIVRVVDVHRARQWLVPRHAEAVRAMLARHGVEMGRLYRLVAGGDIGKPDSDGMSAEKRWAAEGFRWETANMDRIGGAFEVLTRLGDMTASPPIPPTLLIHRRCANLIEMLPALERDPHRPEDVLKVDADEAGNGGDDDYDMLRYGLLALAPAVRAGEYGPSPLAGYRG